MWSAPSAARPITGNAICRRASVCLTTCTRRERIGPRRLPPTRGVKMGDSRDKVRERYPELRDEPFPGLEGDYLWYCAGTPETRASLAFFFEDDTLSRLVLTAPLEDGN